MQTRDDSPNVSEGETTYFNGVICEELPHRSYNPQLSHPSRPK